MWRASAVRHTMPRTQRQEESGYFLFVSEGLCQLSSFARGKIVLTISFLGHGCSYSRLCFGRLRPHLLSLLTNSCWRPSNSSRRRPSVSPPHTSASAATPLANPQNPAASHTESRPAAGKHPSTIPSRAHRPSTYERVDPPAGRKHSARA